MCFLLCGLEEHGVESDSVRRVSCVCMVEKGPVHPWQFAHQAKHDIPPSMSCTITCKILQHYNLCPVQVGPVVHLDIDYHRVRSMCAYCGHCQFHRQSRLFDHRAEELILLALLYKEECRLKFYERSLCAFGISSVL